MQAAAPILRNRLFHPGQRVAVAVSGGADSVALLLRLLEQRHKLGLVLSVAHVNHGIRVAAADDADFVARLAAAHALPFHLHVADALTAAAELRETLEEAARNLRYAFFRQLLAEGVVDSVATAHTLDDQAETVLHKLLRGAWTEGLGGIFPVLAAGPGSILRPFLDNSHAGIEEWLRSLSQVWLEDPSNQDLTYTRNRIRWQLLPMLRTFNPRIADQLARLATISADEEAYWQDELTRLLPALLLPGRPTRGGGRSNSTRPEEETVAIEHSRLRELHPAVSRRVVRAAAGRLGANLSFENTEQVLALAASGTSAGSKFDLPGGLRIERSLRELRLSHRPPVPETRQDYSFSIPGAISAPDYGLNLRVESDSAAPATLRPWKAGDRVTLRHSGGPKKVAEILDRLHVVGSDRENWPVVESQGKILWMRGVEVEAPGFRFIAQPLP
ncbi:MAG: tRNA lysidine(34) synthetase TilS [Acidobacteriaceae bacterium]